MQRNHLNYAAALPRPGKMRLALSRAARRIRVPAAVRSLAEMPLTLMGTGSIVAGVLTVSLISGLVVAGVFLIGLEYLITSDKA